MLYTLLVNKKKEMFIMKILVVFKNGEKLEKENVRRVFCDPKDDALFLIYGPYASDNFCLSEISFYNIES